MSNHTCTPALPRPNTTPLYPVFDSSLPILLASPSPFALEAWETLLSSYPGALPHSITGILKYGVLLGYEGPEKLSLSQNLLSARLNPQTITGQLQSDLILSRVIHTTPDPPFISSPLGLVPKSNGGFRRIHHLSFPNNGSVNFFIPENYSTLLYTTLHDIYEKIRKAGRNCIILKKDIKDAFRNIPVATTSQWLLGFKWEGQYYKETCLPFGLATAPFLFNLFAEAFHWILQSWLPLDLEHYLDDFIFTVPQSLATPRFLSNINTDFNLLTQALGLPMNTDKDRGGTKVVILGVEVDTTTMEARLPTEKLQKAIQVTTSTLQRSRLSLQQAQAVAGYLSWCSNVVKLGRVYLRHLWNFIAAFPSDVHPKVQYSIPREVREDLLWWNTLLPKFNGRYFIIQDREIIHLYSDASQTGLGAYYVAHNGQISLPVQTNSFSTLVPTNLKGHHINILEISAIQTAFHIWGIRWARKRVVVHTDNTIACQGLIGETTRGPAFYPLRHILLTASEHDILIQPQWISGKANKIADALSRFNWDLLANLCSHWQFPYNISPFPTTFSDLSVPKPTA
jgi:hypothetical protein